MNSARNSPARARRWPMWATLWLAAACPVAMTGCNLFMIGAYLLGGPPSVEPDFEAATRTSLSDKDTVVAVVCYAPLELRADIGNEKIDRDVARMVAAQLAAHKIEVRHTDQVAQWVARNPDWDDPGEIAEAMRATHVVYIDLSKFSLYEENSADLYRGRAEAVVTVTAEVEPGSGEWEDIYSKEIISRYPKAVAKSTSEMSYAVFRRKYLMNFSKEVGWLFFPHYNGDDFGDAA